jgi:hypothetical protein
VEKPKRSESRPVDSERDQMDELHILIIKIYELLSQQLNVS